jgi:hypothetical protein
MGFSPAHRSDSIAPVVAFWIALGILVVALVAGAALVVRSILETRRTLKSLKSALEVELKRIAGATEHSTSTLEAAGKAFERLEHALARMSTARARVLLIKEVLAEAEAVLARARAFVPSK